MKTIFIISAHLTFSTIIALFLEYGKIASVLFFLLYMSSVVAHYAFKYFKKHSCIEGKARLIHLSTSDDKMRILNVFKLEKFQNYYLYKLNSAFTKRYFKENPTQKKYNFWFQTIPNLFFVPSGAISVSIILWNQDMHPFFILSLAVLSVILWILGICMINDSASDIDKLYLFEKAGSNSDAVLIAEKIKSNHKCSERDIRKASKEIDGILENVFYQKIVDDFLKESKSDTNIDPK